MTVAVAAVLLLNCVGAGALVAAVASAVFAAETKDVRLASAQART